MNVATNASGPHDTHSGQSRLTILITAMTLVIAAAVILVPSGSGGHPSTLRLTAGSSGSSCVFASAPAGDTPAFCDDFNEGPSTNPANAREGQLSSVAWGASRISGNENFSSPADGWANAQVSTCGSTGSVAPPNDIQICNGQLVDTVNDGGTVTALAMYPKQPFDFGGRTGTIAFDVNDNSQGSHAAWPELWMSDQPVPDPFTHEGSGPLPRNGFGIRFAGCTTTTCSVDSAVTISNYVANDSFQGQGLVVNQLGTVTISGPGQVNHFEVRVSQGQVDVYGTNAYSGVLNLTNTPLIHMASIPNANLTFTRGLVWIEDAHYNGNKFNSQRNHTFTWENVGFDGPALPKDLGFDVPDNTLGGAALQDGDTGINLGYNVAPNSSQNLTVPGVSGVENASGALLVFDFWHEMKPPFTLDYSINGTALSVPWPFPDNGALLTRSLAIPVPLADVHDGTNTVTFTTGSFSLNVSNVSLIMVGAGGRGSTGSGPTTTTGSGPTTTTDTGTGAGTLRVMTNPAVASQITITPQGGASYTADNWGLNWLLLPPGTYTVTFGAVPGYTDPAPQTVTITSGATTDVTGNFSAEGTLKVSTTPAVNATITVDGNPVDNWGVWTYETTGTHEVCFGPVAGHTAPPCQTVTITAKTETDITGTYS